MLVSDKTEHTTKRHCFMSCSSVKRDKSGNCSNVGQMPFQMPLMSYVCLSWHLNQVHCLNHPVTSHIPPPAPTSTYTDLHQ